MSKKSGGSRRDKKTSRWARILTVVPLLTFLLAGAKLALDYWERPAPVRIGFVSLSADALSDLAENEPSVLQHFALAGTNSQVLLRPSQLMTRVIERSKRQFVNDNGREVHRATFVAVANATTEQLSDVTLRFADRIERAGSLQPNQVLVLCLDSDSQPPAVGGSAGQWLGGTVAYSRGQFEFNAPPLPAVDEMNIVQGNPNVRISEPNVLKGLSGK